MTKSKGRRPWPFGLTALVDFSDDFLFFPSWPATHGKIKDRDEEHLSVTESGGGARGRWQQDGEEPKGKKSFRALVAHWLTFGTAGFLFFFSFAPPRARGRHHRRKEQRGILSKKAKQQQEQGEGRPYLAFGASLTT